MSADAGDGPAREPLELIHHHPGRLRLRSEAFRKGDAAQRARAALEVEPGIVRFSHNPRTGSALIEYQPGLADVEAIIAHVAAAAGLEPPPGDHVVVPRREPGVVVVEGARELNEIVYELTGYRAELRTLVPAGMAALAAYSLAYGKGERLPRWDNLLYWSYNIFTHLHGREIDGPLHPEGAAPPEGAASGSKPRDPGEPDPKP